MGLKVLFGAVTLCVSILCGCSTILMLKEQIVPVFDVDLSRSKEQGNRINFIRESEDLIFEVHSQGRVGEATISLIRGTWASKVCFRFYLHGLESFSVNNGAFVLNTAILSYPPYSVLCEINAVEEEYRAILEETSSYWMPAKIVPIGKRTSKIPLQTGYIEVVVPKIVFGSKPENQHIKWIDFFR